MLVNASPLSDTVLLSLIYRTNPLAPGLFKDIIIPNSPVSDYVLPDLEQKLVSLPQGIAKQINDAQAYNPAYQTPASISRQISYRERERQLLFNSIVQYYVFNDSVNMALNYLEQDTSLNSRQAAVGTYLELKRYTDARSKLQSIPMNTQQDIAFYDLYSMLIDHAQAGKTIYELDSVQLQLVRQIAQQCPASTAAHNAQSLLSMLFGEEFTPCPESVTAKSLHINNFNSTPAITDIEKMRPGYLLSINPNPSGDKTFIYYRMPDNSNDAELVIRSAQGAEIKTYILIFAENTLVLEAGELPGGFYTVSLTVNSQTIGSKKLVIIK